MWIKRYIVIDKIHCILFLVTNNTGFPGGDSGKEPACQGRRCKRQEFSLWVRKIPCRRKWLPTPVLLPGESQGQRSLADYSSQGHQELDATEAIWHAHTNNNSKLLEWAEMTRWHISTFYIQTLQNSQKTSKQICHTLGIVCDNSGSLKTTIMNYWCIYS